MVETDQELQNYRQVSVWNTERLWELSKNLPIRKVPLENLLSVLDSVRWYGEVKNNGCSYLTVKEVARHAKRIIEASLEYPIILAADGSLLDGTHRIAKAYLLGLTEISAVQFDKNPAPDDVCSYSDWMDNYVTKKHLDEMK